MKAPSGPYADKLWRDALRRAILKRVEGKQNLTRLAEATVRRALDDDYPQSMAAAKEIGDRLDGKAAQSMSVEIGANERLLQLIEGRIARAAQR